MITTATHPIAGICIPCLRPHSSMRSHSAGRVDRLMEFEFIAPGVMCQFTGALPVGAGGYERGERRATFDEDAALLEAQHSSLKARPEPLINTVHDLARVIAERKIDEWLAAEAADQSDMGRVTY